MKKIKKIVSVLLTMIMALTMMAATTVFAADIGTTPTYTITINNDKAGHIYEAYQIFAGDLNGNTLSNVVWGSGVDDAKLLTEVQKIDGYDSCGTAADVAEILKNKTSNSTDADIFAAVVSKCLTVDKNKIKTSSENKGAQGQTTGYTIDGLDAGYYFVKNNTVPEDDAYTKFMLKIVKNTTVVPKSAKPTVDKQVQDETTDAETGAADGWGETADHAINESFKFKLKAALPADTDFAAYPKYKVVFTDVMSEGVTFESVESVTVDGVTVAPAGYTCTATADQAGGSWTLTIADIKAITGVNLVDGANVEVIYNAHLNEKAQVNNVTGNTTNKNTVSLQYSNNPNVGGENDLGKTPEDHVWVFTYKVDNTKVDGETNAVLPGAGFKLYDAAGTTEIGLIYDNVKMAYRPVKAGETAVEMTSAEKTGCFNIIGLDAGTYTLKETTTPSGYNTCADVTITISATHAEDGSGNSATTTLTNNSNMTNKVENNRGSVLPETGGMGTTIIYIIGAALVLGSAILLITKKRMSSEK